MGPDNEVEGQPGTEGQREVEGQRDEVEAQAGIEGQPEVEGHRAGDSGAAVEGFTRAWDDFLLAVRRAQARGPSDGQSLTLSQYYLLLPLRGDGALPVSQLAERAGLSAPTVTRVVDGLQRSGLLTRERSDRDRRAVLVSLTPAGQERMRRKEHDLAQRRRRLYEQLDPGEREHAERLLRHLAELVSAL
jgi:DNA-binding MarR family transcriptional regulator